MKIKNIYKIILLSCIALACDDNLEITPSSSVIPEDYLKEESQLDSYIINRYTDLPNAGGGVGLDNGTDNEAAMSYSTLYTEGESVNPEVIGILKQFTKSTTFWRK